MRDTMIIGMLALVFFAPGVRGELPGKGGEYLRKLQEYEVERVDAAKKEIWEKRVQVAAVLKRELVAATKRGDLEGANALKAEIDRLAGDVDLAAIKSAGTSEMAEASSKKDLEKTIVGQKWKDMNGRTFLFERRGKIVYGETGKESEEGLWEWKAEGTDAVTITSVSNSSNVIKFTFTGEKDGTKLFIQNGEAGKETPIALVE